MQKKYSKYRDVEKKISLESSLYTDSEIEELKLELQESSVNISNSFAYLEGALKEIGLLQDAYDQIKKNKNIPDDWSELDFEKEEINAHIRSSFRNGIRDFMCHGRLGMGTCEYFEQFGISPIEASFHIREYIDRCNRMMSDVNKTRNYDNLPDYDDFHDFLNRMVAFYKNAYKKACERIGLDGIISLDFILMSARNKNELAMLEEKTTDI